MSSSRQEDLWAAAHLKHAKEADAKRKRSADDSKTHSSKSKSRKLADGNSPKGASRSDASDSEGDNEAEVRRVKKKREQQEKKAKKRTEKDDSDNDEDFRASSDSEASASSSAESSAVSDSETEDKHARVGKQTKATTSKRSGILKDKSKRAAVKKQVKVKVKQRVSDSADNEKNASSDEDEESADKKKKPSATKKGASKKDTKQPKKMSVSDPLPSWMEVVRKLLPETGQMFCTDEPSHEKVSTDFLSRPLSSLHIAKETGIEAALEFKSIGKHLLHGISKKDRIERLKNILSPPMVSAAVESKVAFKRKSAAEWQEEEDVQSSEKKITKMSKRWCEAIHAVGSSEARDAIWSFAQLKKAKSLHVPSIPLPSLQDKVLSSKTMETMSNVESACAVFQVLPEIHEPAVAASSASPSSADSASAAPSTTTSVTARERSWNDFAKAYNCGKAIPGFGSNQCQVSIRSGITCTKLHDEIGWSSSVNYMSHQSQGIALWLGISMKELDEDFDRPVIRTMMEDCEIDNIITTLLDMKPSVRKSMCHLWQRPGDIVFTPSGSGYAYIVITVGPYIEQLSYNRSYSLQSLQECMEFWKQFNAVPFQCGLATNYVLPTLRLRYVHQWPLDMDADYKRLEGICSEDGLKVAVLQANDIDAVCEMCFQTHNFLLYHGVCDVCLLGLTDEQVKEAIARQSAPRVKANTAGQASSNGRRSSSGSYRGRSNASLTDKQTTATSSSKQRTSVQHLPEGQRIFFSKEELLEAERMLCWRLLVAFSSKTDVVGYCRCIPCRRLRTFPPVGITEMIGSKCCWKFLNEAGVPLNLIQCTCLCASCRLTESSAVGSPFLLSTAAMPIGAAKQDAPAGAMASAQLQTNHFPASASSAGGASITKQNETSILSKALPWVNQLAARGSPSKTDMTD